MLQNQLLLVFPDNADLIPGADITIGTASSSSIDASDDLLNQPLLQTEKFISGA